MYKLEKVVCDILEDKRFLTAMREIDEPAVSGKKIVASFNSLHGIAHAKHVMNYAVKFLQDMKASERDIELVKIATLLHDVALQGHNKGNHAKRSAELAHEWLADYKLEPADVETICHAISVHSNGDDAKNLIDYALLLGDKMDITGDRLNLSRLNKWWICQRRFEKCHLAHEFYQPLRRDSYSQAYQ
jgi:predicted metal-dependent HD superfamily phosphohydrolase